MSLIGSLEDLALSDILQIVSLSRKSGVLTLKNPRTETRVVFQQGEVVSAFNPRLAGIAHLAPLVNSGLVSSTDLGEIVRSLDRLDGDGTNLVDALIKDRKLDELQVQEALSQVIADIILDVFTWREGHFNFELKPIEADIEAIHANPLGIVLSSGINPQFLSMEGARLADERRREEQKASEKDDERLAEVFSSTVKEDYEALKRQGRDTPLSEDENKDLKQALGVQAGAAPVPSSANDAPGKAVPSAIAGGMAAPGLRQRKVYLIDDDPAVLRTVGGMLDRQGVRHADFTEIVSAFKAYDQEADSDKERVVFVADLLMPRVDMSGMLGGIEVLEILRERRISNPVIVVSDHENSAALDRARQLGIEDFLSKPRKKQFMNEAEAQVIADYLKALLDELTRRVGGAGEPDAQPVESEFAASDRVEASSAPETPIESPPDFSNSPVEEEMEITPVARFQPEPALETPVGDSAAPASSSSHDFQYDGEDPGQALAPADPSSPVSVQVPVEEPLSAASPPEAEVEEDSDLAPVAVETAPAESAEDEDSDIAPLSHAPVEEDDADIAPVGAALMEEDDADIMPVEAVAVEDDDADIMPVEALMSEEDSGSSVMEGEPPMEAADLPVSAKPPGMSPLALADQLEAELEFELEDAPFLKEASSMAMPPIVASPGLAMLRSMTRELQRPENQEHIPLLILRFASELMSRAVLFFVSGTELISIGAFGINTPEGARAGWIDFNVPLDTPDNIFQFCRELGVAFRGKVDPGYWSGHLAPHMGRAAPEQSFLAPVLADERTVAILYGDNMPEGSPVGETEALEIFLAQAGMALNLAALERRIRSQRESARGAA